MIELKYIKDIYDKLSQGAFISENSTKENIQLLYKEICNHQEEYYQYFSPLGLILTEGNGYYYFTRKEKKQDIVEKIKRFEYWIRILDFLKLYDSSISSGSYITKLNICARIDSEDSLRERASKIADSTGKDYDKMVNDILEAMEKMGFAERVGDLDGKYKITSAYNYLEDMVNLISFKDNE